jgi:hypothetical protein
MRKSLWIMLAVLLVAVGAPNAHADSFSVTFTSFGPPPTAMDVTFPSPTLDITWQGTAFTFAFPSSFLPGDQYFWTSTAAFTGAGITVFMTIDDNTQSAEINSNIVLVPPGFAIDAGSLTFTPTTAAPEPSSVGLMLLGLGLVFVMRKRIGQGLPQAS